MKSLGHYCNLVILNNTVMRIELKNIISPSKRIDRAIELLIHYKLTLIEVAYQLNYGSVDEFENQFRDWVGYSPEDFKQLILWDSEKESRAMARL